MKLAVIPGLNGNDQLCQEFLELLTIDTQFIPLPEDCPQDHQSLAKAILPQLPNEPFILLVESYSGSIAPYLLQYQQLAIKGVIFFVSLLATPSKALLELPKFISAKTLLKLPLVDGQLRKKYLNNDATPEQVQHVKQVVQNIPDQILQQRAEALKKLTTFPPQPDVPVAFVEASNDHVLNRRAQDSIKKVYPQAQKYEITGSHFLLYTKPKESAELVEEIINRFIAY